MAAEAFIDANVLLYAFSAAPADAVKRRRATDLILNTPFALSAQVLQGFIANALRKKALGINEAVIDAPLELASHVPVLPEPWGAARCIQRISPTGRSTAGCGP